MKFEIYFVMMVVIVVSVKSQSMSNTEYEMQEILDTLIERQNRVKSAIDSEKAKITAAIVDLKPSFGLVSLVDALQRAFDFLTSIRTLDDYGSTKTASLNCASVSIQIARMKFEIQNCFNLKYKVDLNASLILEQYNNLTAVYLTKKDLLSDTRKQAIESILQTLYLNFDEYYQYGLTLTTSIYRYSIIWIDLLFCKTTYCSCPQTLTSSSATAFAIVDNTLELVQNSVSNWEDQIKSLKIATTSLINDFNSGMKKNSNFLSITTTLDAIITLLNGYGRITTFTAINSTGSCDDAAFLEAFIEHKTVQYFQTMIESQKNSSYIFIEIGLLNGYFYGKYYSLSDDQKSSVQSVITSAYSLMEIFRQYTLSLIIGSARIYQLLYNVRNARNLACICTTSTEDTTPALGANQSTTAVPKSTTSAMVTSKESENFHYCSIISKFCV